MKLVFRGEPADALLQVPDGLLHYVLCGLKNEPSPPSEAAPEEWAELSDILVDHHVLPLLHRNMQDWPKDCRPPDGFFQKTRESYFWSAARTHEQHKQLKTLMDAFGRNAVRAVVLKGPALALSIYPDPFCRPSDDIDLLVHPDQVTAAGKVMEDLGYRCVCKRFDTMKDFFNDDIYAHRTDPRTNRMVEIHWDLHRFSSLRSEGMIDDLFDRSVEAESDSFVCETLSPADALIHRAIGNAFDKARTMRLIWIVDVAMLAVGLESSEWEQIARTSPAYNARSAVEFSLKAAEKWLGLKIPYGYDDFDRWPPPTPFEAKSWEKAARSYDSLVPLLMLCNSPSSSLVEKIRAYFHLAFPDKSSMQKDYTADGAVKLMAAHVKRWRTWLAKFRFSIV